MHTYMLGTHRSVWQYILTACFPHCKILNRDPYVTKTLPTKWKNQQPLFRPPISYWREL